MNPKMRNDAKPRSFFSNNVVLWFAKMPAMNNNEKTHIAHVTFNMDYGGAEKVIEHIVKAADKSKYHMSVLCLDQPIGPVGQQLRYGGTQVAGFNRQPGFDYRLIVQMKRYIRQKKIDILHCHQYTPYTYGLFASLATRTKVIFTEHGRFYPDQRRLKRYLLNPLLNRLTSAVTAISTATATALVNFEHFPRKKVRVIYNGIAANDANQYRAHPCDFNFPANAFVLGAVGRLDTIKNQKLMLHALTNPSVDMPDLYLLIIGDGPERRNLEQLALDLKIRDRVIFAGWQENPAPFYALMHVFLLTSFSEGTAMTLLEAMAAGVPAVVTNAGGNSEIIQDGATGFIIPNDDQAALVEKIKCLKTNPELRRKLGAEAQRRFQAHFTVEKMVSGYRQLYDEITAEN
jgi:glycosyltransferase involved in cell wall biosynthesis